MQLFAAMQVCVTTEQLTAHSIRLCTEVSKIGRIPENILTSWTPGRPTETKTTRH